MNKIVLVLLSFSLFLFACERDIDLNFPPGEPTIVVEGYIENDLPPYVILSYGLPFFGKITPAQFQSYLIRGAKVIVSDGTQTDTLQEIEFNGSVFYSTLNMRGKSGRTYDLKVIIGDKTITSTAMILPTVPLDSIWTIPAPEGRDTNLVQLMCRLQEPSAPGNYYRGFTKRNSEFLFDTSFGSIYDDHLVNGKKFNFTLLSGKSNFQNNDTANFENYGYFSKGDTIYVKWASIDRPQFDFWNTFESQSSSFGNPFASTVILKSNIKGDNTTGIWASYGAFLDTLVVK